MASAGKTVTGDNRGKIAVILASARQRLTDGRRENILATLESVGKFSWAKSFVTQLKT